MENKAISSDLIRGHIDTIILYSLLNGQKTSQQIIDSVYEKSENKYQLNQATLYSSLKRLESLKLLSSVWHDSEDGRRKFFKLTDEGHNTVSANLSNWEYSRAIIDKLIGFGGNYQSGDNVRVVEVEKIVEKPVYIEKVVEKPVSSTHEILFGNAKSSKTDDDDQDIKIEKQPSNENITEINFRNILTGLIKANEKPKQEVQEITVAEDAPVKNFNETINDVENSYKNTTNKIDFTDLKEKVELDGYKLSVSSKDNKLKTGTLFINKLNLYTSLALSLVLLLEFLVFAVCTKGIINYTVLPIALVIVLSAALPFIFGVIYKNNPKKTVNGIKKDSILYAAIIAFNLILFTVVLNLLFGVNFANKLNVAFLLVLPIILVADIVIFYSIRYAFSKFKTFSTKKKN